MEKSIKNLGLILALSLMITSNLMAQQESNYKHPYLNSSGKVLSQSGVQLAWVSPEGIVYNAKGDKVAQIGGININDSKGKKTGSASFQNGLLFAVESEDMSTQSALHESYKNQAYGHQAHHHATTK